MPDSLPTRDRLRLAFKKLKQDADRAGKPGPSINAVARAVGVSHALIHNKYSDIADEIRNASGRGPKQQLETQRLLAKKVENRAGELGAEVEELRKQNRGLASENARLILLVARLEQKIALLEAGVPILIGGKTTFEHHGEVINAVIGLG